MSVLITGACGFVGKYLIREIAEKPPDSMKIFGIGIEPEDPVISNSLDGYQCIDITARKKLRECLIEVNPDIIFHLAAQSSVAVSFRNPFSTLSANIAGTLNILDIIVNDLECRPLIVLTGSGEIYDHSSVTIPFTEESAISPANPYAMSKAAVDHLGKLYWKNYGLKTIRTRSFNHIGPGQSADFVMPSFASQVAEIEAGIKSPVIKVGNLNARRDFTDVRDVARAYVSLAEKGRHGEVYNVCSGKAISIEQMLDMLLELTDETIEIEKDPERMRPVDIPVSFGDNSRIRNDTGWKPRIDIRQTLRELLEHFRNKIK